jgi:thiamine biosynthesis lipoprotein
MGSELRVVALAADAEREATGRAVQQALDAAERLDRVLSDWKEESELSRVNREAVHGPVPVGPELQDFLQQSAALSAATAGAFDPTIGARPQMRLPRRPIRGPSAAELTSACACGMAGVALDPVSHTVAFTRPGVVLDPGAVGKGMAVDAVAESLRAAGVGNAFVDFRSSQRALGAGPDGRGWPVAVRDPCDADATVECFLLRDAACSTSGGYEKFVEIGGRRFGHILDPATGRPATVSVSSTVIAATGARSDALATALFVLGPERGPAVIDAIPDAAGLVVPAADGGRAAPVRALAGRRAPRSPARPTGAGQHDAFTVIPGMHLSKLPLRLIRLALRRERLRGARVGSLKPRSAPVHAERASATGTATRRPATGSTRSNAARRRLPRRSRTATSWTSSTPTCSPCRWCSSSCSTC